MDKLVKSTEKMTPRIWMFHAGVVAAGIALIIVGAVFQLRLNLKPDFFLTSGTDGAVNAMYAFGALLIILAVFGLFAMARVNEKCLKVYSFLVTILVLISCIALATPYFMEDKILAAVEDEMDKNFTLNTDENRVAWMAVQDVLHCCGVHSYKDYKDLLDSTENDRTKRSPEDEPAGAGSGSQIGNEDVEDAKKQEIELTTPEPNSPKGTYRSAFMIWNKTAEFIFKIGFDFMTGFTSSSSTTTSSTTTPASTPTSNAPSTGTAITEPEATDKPVTNTTKTSNASTVEPQAGLSKYNVTDVLTTCCRVQNDTCADGIFNNGIVNKELAKKRLYTGGCYVSVKNVFTNIAGPICGAAFVIAFWVIVSFLRNCRSEQAEYSLYKLNNADTSP